MKSRLFDAYEALKLMNLTARGSNVQVRGLNELSTMVNPSDIPLRVLLPVDQNSEGRNIGALDFSSQHRVATWKVTDLFLLEYASAGAGLFDAAADLVTYVLDYEAAINSNRQLVKNAIIVEDLMMRMGVYNWPIDGDGHFFGVWCSLTLKEVIQ